MNAAQTAVVLRCSPQNVHGLGEVGHLDYFLDGPNRRYGLKSVRQYAINLPRRMSGDGKNPPAGSLKDLNAFLMFEAKQGGSLSTAQAAVMLRCCRQNISKQAAKGKFKVFLSGRNRRYGLKSLKAYRWTESRKYLDNGSRINIRGES
ncbi:hypothetical protein AAFN60_12700 [Roseibacillus persicicus]|uniref:hypothetical protein n=1 Tax=Roseibacillus persicicus TaxID=454148 RepID=UPI00398AAAA7